MYRREIKRGIISSPPRLRKSRYALQDRADGEAQPDQRTADSRLQLGISVRWAAAGELTLPDNAMVAGHCPRSVLERRLLAFCVAQQVIGAVALGTATAAFRLIRSGAGRAAAWLRAGAGHLSLPRATGLRSPVIDGDAASSRVLRQRKRLVGDRDGLSRLTNES